jgi:protein-S-isoprenylcysteine O-methyltransferase Ste14
LDNLFKQAFSFILPVTAAIIIPLWLLNWKLIRSLGSTGVVSLFLLSLGILLLLLGSCIFLFTVRTFILIGKGTLAPWSPTRHLVVGGMYGYVRNPMISGVFFILAGESLVFASWKLLLWMLIFFFVNHIYFLFVEEPGLVRRFGEPYNVYRKHVPRWVPRRSPWKP